MIRIASIIVISLLTSSYVSRTLEYNKIEDILLENIVLREETLDYTTDQSVSPQYLIVNFNQFRVKDGIPDIPIVSVFTVDGPREILYYSSKKSNWTFDESLVFIGLDSSVPMYRIRIEWRDGGFDTTFKGMVGVHGSSDIHIRFGYQLVSYIDQESRFTDISVDRWLDGSRESYEGGIVRVSSCVGRLQRVEVYRNDTLMQGVEAGEMETEVEIGEVGVFDHYRIRVLGSSVVYRVVFDVHDGSKSTGVLRDVIRREKRKENGPPRVWQNLEDVQWTNNHLKVYDNGLNVKSMVIFGEDEPAGRAKCACSFDPVPYLCSMKVNMSQQSGVICGGGVKEANRIQTYEYNVYTNSSSNSQQTHIQGMAVDEAQGFTHVYVKDYYYSMNNRMDGRYTQYSTCGYVVVDRSSKYNTMEVYRAGAVLGICLLCVCLLWMCVKKREEERPERGRGAKYSHTHTYDNEIVSIHS